MATVPTATTGHDNEPGTRMTVLALVNECKRRPAVQVRELHTSTEWEDGTLTAYAPLSECGGVVFTVVVVRGGVDTVLTVAQDRVRFIRPAMTLAEAVEYGRLARTDGRMRVPSADQHVMVSLAGLPVGSGAADIFRAWLSGWDEANLAAPVDA